MDMEIITLSVVTQRTISIILYHLYEEPKNTIQMNLYTRQTQKTN